MNFFDSSIFVFLVLIAFIPFYIAAWIIESKGEKNKMNISIRNTLFYFGTVFLLLDLTLAQKGLLDWNYFFHYNSGFLIWIPVFLAPVLAFYFEYRKGGPNESVDLWQLAFFAIIVFLIIILGYPFFNNLKDVFISATNRPG